MTHSTMTLDTPTDTQPETKPPKKWKWYWNLLFAIGCLWYCGGIDVLLLRDIPLLLFLIPAVGLFMLPVIWIDWQPKRQWKPALMGFVWMMATLAVIFFVVAFVLPPFYISPQTTYLMKPRAKEYYGIDYAVVIAKQLPSVSPEDNGFHLLVETFGLPLFGEGYKKHWNHICQYLDLPPDIEPKLTYTDWHVFEKTLEPEEQEIAKTSPNRDNILPWSEETLPIVRRWLDENESALDLFVLASQKPGMYIPPVFDHTLLDVKLIIEQMFRNMVRGLQIRVRYQLALGEVDKAWDDVLAMYRLGEHQRPAVHCTVNSLVHIAIVGMANRTAESVVLHSDWNVDEIRRRVAGIMPFHQPYSEDELKNILRNERLAALDSMQYVANNGDFGILSPSGTSGCCPSGPDSGFDEWYKRKALRFNRWGLVMSEINKKFDDMEERFLNDAPEPDGKGRFDGDSHIYELLKLFAWYGKSGAIAVSIGEMMGELLAPAIEAYLGAVKRHEAEGSLLHFVFALEAYRRDNGGRYPARLDDLLPGYMDEIPFDPFSGEAFRYILEEGGYLLYSVGYNGIDDEGRNQADVPKGDDIRRRMPISATIQEKPDAK